MPKLKPESAIARAGRPPKHTPELIKKLAGCIATGLTDQQAADAVGISHDTLSEWRKADAGFSDAVKRATAERLIQRIERIERGEPGWQGTAWILERTMREQFTPPTVKKQLDHSGQVDGTVTHVVTAEEMENLRVGRRRYKEQVQQALLANGQG